MKKIYKESEEEKYIVDRAKARDISQVILDFGVSQPQIYHLIYLLALELENNDHVKRIAALVSELSDKKETKNNIIT